MLCVKIQLVHTDAVARQRIQWQGMVLIVQVTFVFLDSSKNLRSDMRI